MSNNKYGIKLRLQNNKNFLIIERFLNLNALDSNNIRWKKMVSIWAAIEEECNDNIIEFDSGGGLEVYGSKDIILRLNKNRFFILRIDDFPDRAVMNKGSFRLKSGLINNIEKIIFWSQGTNVERDKEAIPFHKDSFYPATLKNLRETIRSLTLIMQLPLFDEFKFTVEDQKAERDVIYI